MESILSLIEKSQYNDPDARTRLLEQMSPLIRKYAAKIHFLEREDALQELYIALLEALPYLDIKKGEEKCLSYMKTAVINRYSTLCKTYLSAPKSEDLESCAYMLEAPPAIDDTYYAIDSYIKSLSSQSIKQKILSQCFYEEKTDREIAAELNVSRQYVNRIKRQLIADYFSQK